MLKKSILILIITLTLAVLAFFSFSYFAKDNGEGDNNPVSEGINFLSQFNPFRSDDNKKDEANPPFVDENGDLQENPDEVEIVAKLKQVSSLPIAGFTIFMKERFKEIPVIETPLTPATENQTSTTTTSQGEPSGKVEVKPEVKKVINKTPAPAPTEFMEALRYVDRSTGNIYQTFIDKIQEIKFSSTVIPKIYDAYFGNHGESVVMRRLKGDGVTIETFLGQLPKEKLGADGEIIETKGIFLTENIQDISPSPDQSKIFYLTNVSNSIVGNILNLRDSKKSQIFDSSFTEWLSFWPSSKSVTLTTKPSGIVLGYMYALDVDKKSFTRVLGDIYGLTTLTSPTGKLVLYSDSNLSLNVYNTETKASTALGVRTLPEKCVWNKTSEYVYCAVPKSIPGLTYPDAWYQGEASFEDQIWKIGIKDVKNTVLVDPILELGGVETDGIKLSLSAYEDYLFFVNKKDSILWELKLR